MLEATYCISEALNVGSNNRWKRQTTEATYSVSEEINVGSNNRWKRQTTEADKCQKQSIFEKV